jgi:hypothetical protein
MSEDCAMGITSFHIRASKERETISIASARIWVVTKIFWRVYFPIYVAVKTF